MSAGDQQGGSSSLSGGFPSDGSAEGLPEELGQRFTAVRELGQSKTGRTYLTRDRQREGKLCVIKELVPQATDQTALPAAKARFEQEATRLYQLDHEQIPKFHQLPKVASPASGSEAPSEEPVDSAARTEHLYLAQDFVQGPTYQSLLESRQSFGGAFSETEITQLLYQLLPVLSYIHSMGVVHRNVSPGNLILRQSDGLPVLIGFGTIETTGENTPGYASLQPINAGSAAPSDDLYGLAATLLVLATGEAPEMLSDPSYGTWRGHETLSPKLGQILKRMLSANPSDRFPTADAVLAELQAQGTPLDEIDGTINGGMGGINSLYPPSTDYPADYPAGYEDNTVMAITASEVMPDQPVAYADSAANESEVYDDELRSPEIEDSQAGASQALIGLLIVLGIAATVLMLYALTRGNRTTADNGQPVTSVNGANGTQSGGASGGEYSPEETARKEANRRRLDSLGISEAYFTRLVDQLFYEQYPVLLTSGPNGGRKPLTSAPEDEPLRIRWDNLSAGLLDTLDNNFSSGSRRKLGSYSEADRSQWRSLIASANVSDRALGDLADAKFFTLFSNQSGRDFLTQPVGQLYYAITDDTAQAINVGSATETVAFKQGELSKDVSSRLRVGEGRIYLVQLSAGQVLRLNLSAPANSTQISLYPPEPTNESPAVFADLTKTTWSGALTQTGAYELVVVNRSNQTIDYQLAMSIDKVTSTPVAPPRESVGTSGQTSGQAANDTNKQPSGAGNATDSKESTGSDGSGKVAN